MDRRKDEELSGSRQSPCLRTRCRMGFPYYSFEEDEEPEDSVVEVTYLGSRWLLDVDRVIALDTENRRLAFENACWLDLSEEDFCKVKDLWIKLKKRK